MPARGPTFLGALCKRGHDHEGSGKSVRLMANGGCAQCRAYTGRARRQAIQRQGVRRQRSPHGKAVRRAWTRAHAESERQRQAAYRKTEQSRAWWEANRVRVRALMRLGRHRRRARLAATVVIPYGVEEVAALFAAYDGRCAYCGGLAVALDHVVPISRRGHDALYNVAPCCKRCNSSKRDHLIEAWFPRQRFFSQQRAAFVDRICLKAWHREPLTTPKE